MARTRRRSKPLRVASRRRMARSSFALPRDKDTPKGVKGRYPIDTLARAHAALTYGARAGFTTRAEYKTIQNAVRRRWPSIEVGGVKTRRRK